MMFIALDEDVRINSKYVLSYRKYDAGEDAFAISFKLLTGDTVEDFYVAYSDERARDDRLIELDAHLECC